MRAPILILAGLLGLPSVALAECPAPYTSDNVLADLGNIEDFLRSGDNGAASTGAERLQQGLGCLNEVLPGMITGRVYRAIGAGLVAGGNDIGGFDWFLTAVEIDPTFTYGIEDLNADHPARLSYEDAKREIQGEPVVVEGKTFGPGIHYLDGRKLSEPAARLGRPHLFQIDNDGVESWLIESNDFPAEAFAAAAVVDAGNGKAPKGKKPKKEKKPKKGKEDKTDAVSDGVTVLGRERPWEKTPLMIGGGLIIGGAGALYFMSAQKHGEFLEASTKEEVDQLQAATNQLFIASGAALAVGAGTLTWGIILHDGAPMPSVGFRF